MEKHEMVPGRKYRVNLHDCCIQGEFVAEFVRYEKKDGEEFDEAVFDTARIGPDWGQWSVEEVKDCHGQYLVSKGKLVPAI